MSEISEIREKTKEELIKKWENVKLSGETNLYQGNFVPPYYPLTCFRGDGNLVIYSINAIEYHIRMLNNTKNYILNIQKTIIPIGTEEKYAGQRLDNAITLLENIRAELIYVNILAEIRKLKDAVMKKDLERLDFSIDYLYRSEFDKNGYVRPYLTREEYGY